MNHIYSTAYICFLLKDIEFGIVLWTTSPNCIVPTLLLKFMIFVFIISMWRCGCFFNIKVTSSYLLVADYKEATTLIRQMSLNDVLIISLSISDQYWLSQIQHIFRSKCVNCIKFVRWWFLNEVIIYLFIFLIDHSHI